MTSRVFSVASERAQKNILLIAAIFMVASWAFSGWQIYTERDARLQRHFSSTYRLTNIFSEQMREKLQVNEYALLGLSQLIDITRLHDPSYREIIYTVLNRRRVSTPGVIQFTIVDENGTLLHSSHTPHPEPIDMSTKPTFGIIRDSAPGTTLTIPVLIGTIGATEGKKIVATIRRLETPDGKYAGAIYSATLLDDFAAVAKTMSFDAGSSFGLARIDGTLILRIPEVPGAMGITPDKTANPVSVPPAPATVLIRNPESDRFDAANISFAQALQDRGDAIIESAVPANSTLNTPETERYITFRRIPGTDTIVYIGSSKQAVLQSWRDTALFLLIQQLFLTALVLGLTLWARRSITTSARVDAQHVSTLDKLATTSAELMAIDDEQSLVDHAAHTIRALIPAHMAAAHFIPHSQAMSDSTHAFSLSEKYAHWRAYNTPVDGTGIYRGLLQTNQTMRLTHSELIAHPYWRNFGTERDKHPPMNGWLAAPLISQDGQNIGFVQLSDRENGEFTAADEALLLQFTRVLSISLENLRLVHESQTSAAQAQAAAAQAQAAAADARSTRDQITKVFSATSDAVVVMDHNMRYTFANDAFCAMIGSPREDIIGRTIYERLPDARNIHEKLELCLNTRKRVLFENSFINHEEEQRWIEVQAFPMDESIAISIRDVTERRAADQKLMVAQRMDAVGRLSGGLAHDFNNLLAVVMGNAEILSMTLKDQSQTRMANLIRSAAARGGNIVSRLLAFARSRPLAPKPTDVLETAKGVETLLARSIPSNIAFVIEPTMELWQASADTAQLENVLVNLVLNARDAMPDGGEISIKATNLILRAIDAAQLELDPGEYVKLSVTDTGTGMPPDVIARAFEPFFTTKDVGKGSGLGLSMVYGFAQQSGGTVRLNSEIGLGTTVDLYLPRASDKLTTSYISTSLPYDPTGSERILLVEDDDMVREFVEVMLRGLGYRVIAHSSAETALAAVDAGFQPQLLLADVMLRGVVSGAQLAQQVMQRCPFTRVLYMSGYAESLVAQENNSEINAEVLTKPFRRHDLAVKIRTALTTQPQIIERKVQQNV